MENSLHPNWTTVQGVLGALDTAAPGQDRLFNLGNTNPHTVNELVSGLEVALGKTAVRQYFDLPNLGEVLQTHSNISAAAAAFNYSPKVSSFVPCILFDCVAPLIAPYPVGMLSQEYTGTLTHESCSPAVLM